MNASVLKAAIDAVTDTIIRHAENLTALDGAIGDGDHGANMKRGFTAVAEQSADLSALALNEALKKIGMILVAKVGGASGPLYGTFFLEAGKAWRDPFSREALRDAVAAGIDGLKRRGKAEVGEKTLLDVWVPVLGVLNAAVERGDDIATLADAVERAAEEGLASTELIEATKGRAAYLGARSVGHLDPGARSSFLIIAALCQVAKQETGE